MTFLDIIELIIEIAFMVVAIICFIALKKFIKDIKTEKIPIMRLKDEEDFVDPYPAPEITPTTKSAAEYYDSLKGPPYRLEGKEIINLDALIRDGHKELTIGHLDFKLQVDNIMTASYVVYDPRHNSEPKALTISYKGEVQ